MSSGIKFTSTGKGSRMLAELRGLPSNSTCILEAEPGKHHTKICKLGIPFISLQVCELFKLGIMR